jgi:CheY-like chemotaxis protein
MTPATRIPEVPSGWPLRAMSIPGGPRGSASEGTGDDLALRGRNILVVEDESLIALLIVDALEEAGAFIVGPCYTLAECLKAARGGEIDVAVLDIDLSGEDVFPAAEELRGRNIPFVFHTAHGEREELRSRFGDVPVCRKPMSMDELVQVLNRLVGSPSPS